MTMLKENLERLGDLHDASLQAVIWDVKERTLEFKFKDIYANFVGLSAYPGATPDSLVLREVKEVHFAIDAKEHSQFIYEFTVNEVNSEWIATILFRPSGRITAKFGAANLLDISALEIS